MLRRTHLDPKPSPPSTHSRWVDGGFAEGVLANDGKSDVPFDGQGKGLVENESTTSDSTPNLSASKLYWYSFKQ